MPEYVIETYGELEPALSQEWLLTNGTGSFTSGTVVGCNTRKYHALLCAATLPPVGRVVFLNRIHEILTLDGDERHEFSVNQFGPNEFFPRGERYLQKFTLRDFAQWDFLIGPVKVTKQVLLCWHRDVAVVRYHVEPNGRRVDLMLLPLCSIRDFHTSQRGTDRNYQLRCDDTSAALTSGDHTLHVHANGGTFEPKADWWKGHYYRIEAERGQDELEDLYAPGHFRFAATAPGTLTLIAGIDAVKEIDWDSEIAARHEAFQEGALHPALKVLPKHGAPVRPQSKPTRIVQRLIRAANDFVVGRKCPDGSPGVTIIAGYPWFADWGRDTMISLPGLLLTTSRFHEAERVLTLFAEYVSEGMIPNKFDDYTNEPHYNTVDASLWFIHACHEYVRLSKDTKTFQGRLLPACHAIIDGYTKGTRWHIKMDPADGLISQGDVHTQLTWMDAKCNGVAFTPRQGKPVEINALWYNALMLMHRQKLAHQVRESFVRAFWISPFRGLADVVDGTSRDTAVRPNQIFAVSLPHSPLNHEQQRAVIEVVRRELLTPVGLRTLAGGDPKFHPIYTGRQFQRDEAYHNGTIWPWLIGAFLEAYLKVNHRSSESVEQARKWLEPLIGMMQRVGCIGQIAEIFEAREPHRPVGCGAQAWSVAEVLRLAVELEM